MSQPPAIHGLAEVPEPGHDLPGGAAGRRVETSGRLVQEDELRVADQGEGEIEPAPLAARQPAAERARLAGQTDQGDDLVDIPRRAIEPGVHGQALPDGQAGLGPGLLQDHAHPVPPGTARRARVVPQDTNLPRRALPEAFEDLNRRGLTAPFGPRNAKISPAAPRTLTAGSDRAEPAAA
jgi:hypothetical protein